MRTLSMLLAAFALTVPTVEPAHAELKTILPPEIASAVDDLRVLIAKNDFAGVEAMLAAEHHASLQSHQYEEQRRVFNTFSTSNPKTTEFVDAYLKAYPDSPYALVAKAWNLKAAGIRVRGTALARWTYPDALEIFDASQTEALDYARRAYDLAPDLVSASNAVLRLEGLTGGQYAVQQVIAEVMAVTPNQGSLLRAAEALDPNWGGSVDDMAELCTLYASKVTDVADYDEETCLIDIVFNTPLRGEAMEWAQQALEQNDNPVLEYARVQGALEWAAGTDASWAVLKRYLADPTTVDWRAAMFYDTNVNEPNGLPKVAPEIWKRLIDHALKELPNDPYDADLLEVLYPEYRNDWMPLPDATQTELLEARKRALQVSPYDPGAWVRYARQTKPSAPEPQSGPNLDPQLQSDPFFINAIVYSNHRPRYLTEFAGRKYEILRLIQFGNLDETAPLTTLPPQPELVEGLVCPLIRLTRLTEELCSNQYAGQKDCPPPEDLSHWNEIIPLAEAQALCEPERTDTIDAMFYQPQTIDWTKQP